MLEVITRKDVQSVIFVDACDLGKDPGDISFVITDRIGEGVSTHKVPLSILMGLIQKEGKSAYLLGIQPESLEFGDGVSKTANTSLRKIEDVVKKKLC